MLAVRLISIIPPPQAVTQPQAAPNVTSQGSVTPPALPNGTVLSGFIINRDASGNPILRTETGDITFVSPFFLNIGSEVVLRLQQAGTHQSAHILTVNGLPPDVAATHSAFADEPNVIVGHEQTTLRTTFSAALPGQTIATLLVTPALPNNTIATSKPLLPGTSLLLSILDATVPHHHASPLAEIIASPTSTPITTQALANLLAGAETAETPLPSAPPLPVLTPTSQSLSTIAENQEAAISNFSAPLGQTFTATVIARQAGGNIVLSTPIGIVQTGDMQAATIGQQVNVRVTSLAPPNSYTISTVNAAEPLPAASITQLAVSWDSLRQIVDVIGSDWASRLLPTFPPLQTDAAQMPGRITQAANQLIFFISALKGGNFRDWLGENNLRTLEEKGYGALLKKAEGEFLLMARQFSEPPPGQWQSTFIPILAAGELQQLRAFIKREKKKDENNKPTGEEDTRFVLEMELSALGAIQMDGLVKRRKDLLQFDMMIRSHERLPKEMEQDILQIYTSTAELTGTRGQLIFQATPHFTLHPLEEMIPHAAPDVLA